MFFAATCGAGIGNSLKCLVQCIARASFERVDLEYSSYFNSILDVERFWSIENSKPTATINTWMLGVPPINATNFLKDNKTIYNVNLPLLDRFTAVQKGIDLQYDNITDEAKEEVLKYFNAINFKPEILSIVDQISTELNLQDKIGVHIRTWRRDYGNIALYDSLSYIEEINKNASENYFIVSDCDKEIQSYISLGYNITTNTYNSPIKHILDMLLLSKCKKIIGTYMSTFTECAWWFSDCKPVVVPENNFIKNLKNKYNLNF